MPNNNTPYGFNAVTTTYGAEPQVNTAALRGYSIASGYATSIFTGDPVKSSGTASADGRPGIVIGTNGPNRGVFAGVRYTNSQGQVIRSPFWPASTTATDIVAFVYDHPQTIFSVQANASVAATDIGNKADFVSGTGNSVNGNSAYQLDASTIGAQDALLILGLDGSAPTPNDLGSAYAKLLVMLREHELGATLTAV